MPIPKQQCHFNKHDLLIWLQGNPDDERDSQQDAQLEQHLHQCSSCAEQIEQLELPTDPLVIRLRELLRSPVSQTTVSAKDSITDNGPLGFCSHSFSPRPLANSNRWELIRPLGMGGIGEVWIGRDRKHNCEVAVKRLRTQVAGTAAIQQRFLNEARITAQLKHPGTVRILGLHDDAAETYYVMSLIRGSSLLQVIEQHSQKNLSNASSDHRDLIVLLEHWLAIARIVAHAHSQGILHRDLKSENVIIGESGQVTVIDWGLAKRCDDPETDRAILRRSETNLGVSEGEVFNRVTPDAGMLTLVGERLGTPSFMAPEQAAGDLAATDVRTDTYALSAMLYEILTGVPPFSGTSAYETMANVLNQPLVPPHKKNSGIPVELSMICAKGLSRDPRQRFQSATEYSKVVQVWIRDESNRQGGSHG